MDELPQDLVLKILSGLDDSADVARCRLAWRTFNALSPELRFISIQWPLQKYLESRSSVPSSSSPLKRTFLNLVSNLKELESVHIGAENLPLDVSHADVEDNGDDLYLTDVGFVKEWLPAVSGDLKSLSISDFWVQSSWRRSEILSMISEYCHNLRKLVLKYTWLSVENVNPMTMLTALTLEYIKLDDKHLTEFNKCFPNLEVLNLIGVRGLMVPMIELLKLKTCHWTMTDSPFIINIIAPNLITLKLECTTLDILYVDALILSHFHLAIHHVRVFAFKRFDNLKTLWLECPRISSLLSKFTRIETVESLTLEARESVGEAIGRSEFRLDDLHFIFPNMTSLCFNSRIWSEFRRSFHDWGGVVGRLRTFRGYLLMADPGLTFFLVGYVLYRCVNLEEVSLLIHRDVAPFLSQVFIIECMSRWPQVKWRWGVWAEGMEDSWITNE
ncbi:hypothetical protein LXL04_027911 [Taraxacum kok-saghyz]